MDGILGKIGSILRISTKSDSSNNRNFRARDIEGPVTVDQSNNELTVNLPEESLGRERRKDAADGIWDALLEIKNNRITAVFIMDLFHPHNEIKRLRKNPHFAAAMKSLNLEEVTQHLQPKTTAEKHRPYVTDRLWNLLHAYLLVSVRPALLLLGEEKSVPANSVPANRWWEDDLIRNALHGAGMPEGIPELTSTEETPLATCLDAIEQEIRLEVQSA